MGILLHLERIPMSDLIKHLTLLLLYLPFLSCTNHQKLSCYEKNILGDWIAVRPQYKRDSKIVTAPQKNCL